MKPLAGTLGRRRAATLAVALSVPFCGGCSGTSGSGRSATAADTQGAGATRPGQRGARAFYCHDLRIELQDGKRIELSSCAESLRDCEESRAAMARTTGVAKNVTGTCGQAATAECFSQPGENGRAGYFCARTREQCDMRRIIQGTQLPASPCITAVPGRTNGETTGGHEAAGEADSDNIWYCFEQDDNGGGGDQRPGFPLCFARKGECQSIRGRLHADHRAVTRCAMNQGAYCVPFEGEGRTQLICTATANDCATMRRKMGEGGKVNVAACSPARGCGAGAVPCPQ